MVYGFLLSPPAWPLGRGSPPPDTGFTWLLLLQTQGLGLGRDLTEDMRTGKTGREDPIEVGGGCGLHWEGSLFPADQALRARTTARIVRAPQEVRHHRPS